MQAHGNEGGGARAQAVPGDHQPPAAAVQLPLDNGSHQVAPPLAAAAPGALPATSSLVASASRHGAHRLQYAVPALQCLTSLREEL